MHDNDDSLILALQAMESVKTHLQNNADILQSQILGKLGVFVPIFSIKETEELGVNFIDEKEYSIDVSIPYPDDDSVEIRLVLTPDFHVKSIELNKLGTIH